MQSMLETLWSICCAQPLNWLEAEGGRFSVIVHPLWEETWAGQGIFTFWMLNGRIDTLLSPLDTRWSAQALFTAQMPLMWTTHLYFDTAVRLLMPVCAYLILAACSILVTTVVSVGGKANFSMVVINIKSDMTGWDASLQWQYRTSLVIIPQTGMKG